MTNFASFGARNVKKKGFMKTLFVLGMKLVMDVSSINLAMLMLQENLAISGTLGASRRLVYYVISTRLLSQYWELFGNLEEKSKISSSRSFAISYRTKSRPANG